MVAKPHSETGTRGRAGMSLARAQRLSTKADAQSSGKGAPTSLIAAVAVLALGGIGYFALYGGTAAEAPATIANVLPAPGTQIVADVPVTASAQVFPAVAEAPAPVTADPATDLAVAPVAAPLQVFAPRPAMTACLAQVEQHLRDLRATVQNNVPWEGRRGGIRAAAQAALDCPEARLTFNGDFELAATDLADLHVTWDRGTSVLTFTIVDSVPPEEAQVVLTDDGQPFDFIVH